MSEEEAANPERAAWARHAAALVTLARRPELHGADLGPAMRAITSTSATTLGVERVSVWFFRADRQAILCADLCELGPRRHSSGLELLARNYPAYFRALDDERTIAAHDAHRDPRTSEFSTSYLGPLGIASMMDAPIRVRGQTIGVVCHEHVGASRTWRPDEQDFAGSMADFVALAVEASERRNAEEALRRSEELLRQAQKMEALGRLAGGIAHDFNNLLTVILGSAALASARVGLDDPLRREIGEITRAGERARDLTLQLLAFGRRQLLRPQVVSTDDVVSGVIPMLARVIGEDVALRHDASAEPLAALVDQGQLEQAIVNLALNARDAMPKGGALQIRTSRVDLTEAAAAPLAIAPGRYVGIAVRDDGVGMSEEVRGRIFEPFFTTKPVGRGTGLGLPTVEGFVRQSGGAIQVESAPGSGSTFTIYLPLAGEAPREKVETPVPPVLVGHETILVAEDDRPVRSLVQRTLAEAGYRVLVASDAAQALSLASRQTGAVDLLLTDVVMPGMDGHELSIRLQAVRPGLRILFMSGYVERSYDLALGIGRAFLNKPFVPEELLRKVRQVLDSPAAPPYRERRPR